MYGRVKVRSGRVGGGAADIEIDRIHLQYPRPLAAKLLPWRAVMSVSMESVPPIGDWLYNVVKNMQAARYVPAVEEGTRHGSTD